MIQPPPLSALSEALQAFADKRDWQQFHTPKNLSMALTVEAGEILEIFQWMTPQQSLSLNDAKNIELADELGDTFIYLVRLADMAGIDLMAAAQSKLEKNKAKYPAAIVKGSPKKYTEY